jgi:hypothetical protein
VVLLEVAVAAEHKVAGILNTWESLKTGLKVVLVDLVGGVVVVMGVVMVMAVQVVLRTMLGSPQVEMWF